jgi:hypothetical protein
VATKRHDCSGGNRKKQKGERQFKRVERQQASARFAAVHAYKRRVFVIARTFTSFNFFFGLFVGHSRVDALEDLVFRQSGVFEPRNFGAGHNRQAIQMALQNELNCRVRKTDQLEGNSVDADGIQLVGVSDIENLLFCKSGPSQIGSGFGAEEDTLVNVRGAHQLHTSVIADSCVLHLDDLSDLQVRDIEPFKLLYVAGKHPRLVQRTIVREGMLVASHRGEDPHTEKQSLVPHIYIVEAGKRQTRACAWVIPGRKDRCEKVGKLDLINAFDTEHAGHFSNVSKNSFELAPVDDFKAGFDAGILPVGSALKTSDVRARSADNCRDFR